MPHSELHMLCTDLKIRGKRSASYGAAEYLRCAGGYHGRSFRLASQPRAIVRNDRPAFEVASIRPHAGGCGFGSLSFDESPGRFTQCNSLSNFIQTAYVFAARDATRQPHRKLKILGGPAWITGFNDLYDITAKANGRASDGQMSGPMLRALLEDRFKLKLHRETRQLPVYNLTVAKGGAKLKPLKEGACPAVESVPPANLPSPRENAKALADSLRRVRPTGTPEKCPAVLIDGNGPNTSIDIHGENMAEFAVLLSHFDRPVIDRTQLKGLYDIHLKFPRDETPGDALNSAARRMGWDDSIFDAMQRQLGLKLIPGTGPVDVLIIDHVERPSDN